MAGVQKQQAISLADEFLHELVQELDQPDIVGITLGGSYARGTATEFSDVDLACFWREGVKPPPKQFLYRQDKLISVKMTSVTEIREMLKRPDSAMLAVSGKRRLLLDKDGSVARLLEEIEAFRWEDLQEATNAQVSQWMMLTSEDVQKVLREFQQGNAPGLALVITHLVAGLTLLTALCLRTLISSDSTYYQQVQGGGRSGFSLGACPPHRDRPGGGSHKHCSAASAWHRSTPSASRDTGLRQTRDAGRALSRCRAGLAGGTRSSATASLHRSGTAVAQERHGHASLTRKMPWRS